MGIDSDLRVLRQGASTATTTIEPQGRERKKRGPAASAFLRGEVIAGRFEVLRSLGQGGMGQVFAAADLELGGRWH
ncbi:MAG: hypothetical protein MPN21_19680 [Thermoanaerobaculia bacterium]|nr:hypothetical protein [Thermoanaerobaculia bacterium]